MHAQACYDRVERDQSGSIRETLNIVDLELQHGFAPLPNHHLLWGAGYRYARDEIDNLNPVAFLDIGLPGIDGYELARRLRARHGDRALMLVAVTGWDSRQTSSARRKPASTTIS